jgi:hypothetical protein
MNKFFIFILALGVALSTCSKNPVDPGDNFKHPRQYTWNVDTLSFPGSIQTIMEDVWGSSPENVYVVGHNERGYGKMFLYDGKTWEHIPIPLSAVPGPFDLSATYGFAADDIWAVGNHIVDNPNPPPTFLHTSLILHYDGMKWQEVKLTEQKSGLSAIWGSSPDDIWASGLDGTVLHYDGLTWQPVSLPIDIQPGVEPFYNFFSIAGNSPENVYLLGLESWESTGYITYSLLHWQGSSWVVVDSLQYSDFSNIWMSPSGRLYATGSKVNIWSGTVWQEFYDFPGFVSIDISGTDDDNLMVVGRANGGVVAHYDGSDWFRYEELQLSNLEYTDIWTDGKEVFITGYMFGFPQNTVVLHGK